MKNEPMINGSRISYLENRLKVIERNNNKLYTELGVLRNAIKEVNDKMGKQRTTIKPGSIVEMKQDIEKMKEEINGGNSAINWLYDSNNRMKEDIESLNELKKEIESLNELKKEIKLRIKNVKIRETREKTAQEMLKTLKVGEKRPNVGCKHKKCQETPTHSYILKHYPFTRFDFCDRHGWKGFAAYKWKHVKGKVMESTGGQ